MEWSVINNKVDIPVWEKVNLTITEAAKYTNIGEKKIRELIKDPACKFVLYIGNKALIKRKAFENYINQVTYL